MKTVKFTVVIPANDHCESGKVRCPCIAGNEDYDDRCAFFGKSLDGDKKGKVIKCKECQQMTAMLLQEAQP